MNYHEAGAPAPFIVGAPRSGTTLLRLMLDSHPELAIPPETGFFPGIADPVPQGADPAPMYLARLTGSPGWIDMNADSDELIGTLRALPAVDAATALRVFYSTYSARFAKPRWGDKTPIHGPHLRLIQRTLPEARFIHLIRDGRDVAVSVRGLWFAPGGDIATIANDWSERIETIRSQAEGCLHYLEVHFEDLVAAAEGVLARICSFLEIDYSPDMLNYYERAPSRLAEQRGRRNPDGSFLISRAQRLYNQKFAMRPLSPGRIGRWREELSAGEIEEFGRVGGSLLERLGYEPR